MRQWISIGLSIATAAILAGCGGSGGAPMMAPVPMEQGIHDRNGEIGKKATRIISTDLVVTASPIPLPAERFPVVCAEDSCTAMLPTGPLHYNTVEATTFTSEQDSKTIGVRNGVNLRETVGSDEAFDVIDFRGLGGWMKYSVFSADRSTFTGGIRWIGSALVGQHNGTNPVSGSFTWTGAMSGLDELADEDPLIGDATITFDMTRQVLDLAFTNIATLDDGRKYDDMNWNDVQVTDGHFSEGADTDSLSGYFFGPNHEEVSGVFERRHILGAFGANRE